MVISRPCGRCGTLTARPAVCLTVNLGTGVGVSVLDLVKAFELASGRSVPYRVVARRAGDVAACYANPTLAKSLLGWQAQRNLADMCADAWRWQSRNPQGYRQSAAQAHSDGATR